MADPFVYPGVDERTQYIVQKAIAEGVDPTEAVRVAKSEGLGEGVFQSTVFKNGVQEPSYGDFQLYTGGGLGNQFQKATGLDPSDPHNWQKGVDYALHHVKTTGNWKDWYGARARGIVNMTPYDPAHPYDPNATGPQPSMVAPGQPAGGGIIDPQQQQQAAMMAMLAGQGQPAAPPQPSLMNFITSPGALGLATGLLQAGAPSPVRQGIGSALGSGFAEMGKAQQLASANEVKREQLASQSLSDQQTRVMNMLTMQQMMENQTQKKLEAKQAQAGLESDLDTAYSSADGGYKAAEFLSKDPLGEQIAVTPEDKVLMMRYAIANAKSKNPQTDTWFQNMFGSGSEFVMKQYGLDISTPEGLKHADELVGAVETLNKQRSNLVNQLTAMSQGGQRSATALLNRLTGTGAHAGLAVNMNMMAGLRDKVLSQADASGFHIGPHAQEDQSQPSSRATVTPDLSTVPPPTTGPAPTTPPVTATTPPVTAPTTGPAPVQAGGANKPPVAVPRVGLQIFADETAARNWAAKMPPGKYRVQIGNTMSTIEVTP